MWNFARWILAAVCALRFLAAESASSEKWTLQYSFEDSESTLRLTAFRFPSAQRGIAAGYVTSLSHNSLLGNHMKVTPVVLLTSDGGKSWSTVPVKSTANALFFVNDSVGWLVADDGIWMTQEAGRTWKRISNIKALTDIFFLSERHGFAVGDEKRVLETEDGGVHWKPVPAADQPVSAKETTSYDALAFNAGGEGVIVGGNVPAFERDWDLEPLSDAESGPPLRSRQLIYLLTKDSGAHWRASTKSMFGQPDGVGFSPHEGALLLLTLPRASPWPSEVYRIDANNGGSELVFRERDRAITDVLIPAKGEAVIGGYEPPGHVHPSAVPGKVKILRSSDWKNWREIPVDYRAVARNLMFASPGNGDLWAATDTGMILKLEHDQNTTAHP